METGGNLRFLGTLVDRGTLLRGVSVWLAIFCSLKTDNISVLKLGNLQSLLWLQDFYHVRLDFLRDVRT